MRLNMGAAEESILPAANAGLTLQEIGAEFVVYDEANERVHVLNETALEVWKHCDGRTTIASLAEKLAERYTGTSPDTVLNDIYELVDRFRTEGIIS